MNPLYCDDQGFPGTASPFDGGDTAADLGTILALDSTELLSLGKMRELFDISEYAPRRHPDKSKWYGQPDRFSRDQLIPMLCTFVRYPGTESQRLFYGSHKKRSFLFSWNTRGNGQMDMPWKIPDITGPLVWALWIRSSQSSFAKLFLPLLDLELLIGAIQWRFTPKSNQITRNHMLSAITCKKYSPTWTSRLAYWITDFDDLIERWRLSNIATNEYPTADLFQKAVNDLK